MRKIDRVLVVGLDGVMFYFIKRFTEEGFLPNIESLMNSGVYGEALPCPPTDTPTNWTTIATGASTRTHGVTSFYIHIPGEPFELGQKLRSRGQLSRYCKAEYLWNVADRFEIPSLVLNYPAGWPGNLRKGVICLYTWPMPESTPRIVAGVKEYSIPLEACTKLENGFKCSLELSGGLIDKSVFIDFFILRSGDTLRLAIHREHGFELVDVGSWSDWIKVKVSVKESVGYGVPVRGGVVNCLFKLKFLGFERGSVKVLRSEVFTVEGWTSPPGFEEEIVKKIQFLSEGVLGLPERRVEYDIFGKEAEFLVRQRLEAYRLIRILSYFVSKIKWTVCFLHYHIMDSVNHRFLGYLYKDFPFYDENKAELAWKFFLEAYKIVDEFIGLIVKHFATPETLIIVVSDHAALPAWRVINIRKVFIDAGLLSYKKTSKGFRVDWTKTRVFPWIEPLMMWINLEGRDPQGIVKKNEYEEVREQVIDLLQGLKDPITGDRITTMVLTREESLNIGLGDERTGDIVYFLKPPYTIWHGPIEDLLTYMATEEHLKDWLVKDQSRITGIHGYYLSNEKLEDFSNMATLIISGPGIKKGEEFKRIPKLQDIAPTIAYLLNIPPPRENDGRILYEIFE